MNAAYSIDCCLHCEFSFHKKSLGPVETTIYGWNKFLFVQVFHGVILFQLVTMTECYWKGQVLENQDQKQANKVLHAIGWLMVHCPSCNDEEFVLIHYSNLQIAIFYYTESSSFDDIQWSLCRSYAKISAIKDDDSFQTFMLSFPYDPLDSSPFRTCSYSIFDRPMKQWNITSTCITFSHSLFNVRNNDFSFKFVYFLSCLTKIYFDSHRRVSLAQWWNFLINFNFVLKYFSIGRKLFFCKYMLSKNSHQN